MTEWIKVDLSHEEPFRNHIRLEQTGEGVVPLRFTERQMELYAREPAYHIRNGCIEFVQADLA